MLIDSIELRKFLIGMRKPDVDIDAAVDDDEFLLKSIDHVNNVTIDTVIEFIASLERGDNYVVKTKENITHTKDTSTN